MIRRALPAVLALLSLCLTLAAQQTNPSEQTTITLEQLRRTGSVDTVSALSLYQPSVFSRADGSVLIHGLPALTLLDGHRFLASSALGRMGMTPLDLFPIAFLRAVNVQKVNASPMAGTDFPGGVVDLRLNREYSGGELGVFYGRSTGKFGVEEKQAYILGGVGDERFHVTVGAAYEESSGRIPRLSH